MDKAQKQLIDTYFRKRNIAAKKNDNLYGFEDYELPFALKNKMITLNTLNIYQGTKYYNKLWGTNYRIILKFGEYAKDIAFARNKSLIDIFINKQGKLDITGINPNDFYYEEDDTYDYLHTGYYNTLWKTSYIEIYEYNKIGKDMFLAQDENEGELFVNKQGNPDISNIDPDKLNKYDRDIYSDTKELIDKQNG